MAPNGLADFRCVNVGWLVGFRDQLLSGELFPGTTLVVARQDSETDPDRQFGFRKGDTLSLEGGSLDKDPLVRCTNIHGKVPEGQVFSSLLSVKERIEWTTADVAEHVLRTACAQSKSSYLKLMPTDAVSEKEFEGFFVSHPSSLPFTTLVSTLEHFFTSKKWNIETHFVWLDAFCVNQPKMVRNARGTSNLRRLEKFVSSSFPTAIGSFREHVVVMDKWEESLTWSRTWCSWEVFCAATASKHIQVALPEDEYDALLARIGNDYKQLSRAAGRFKLKNTKCSKDIEKRFIESAIKSKSEIGLFNDAVKAQYQLWLAAEAVERLDIEEENSKQVGNFVHLCSDIGATYRDHKQYVIAEELYRRALALIEQITNDRSSDAAISATLTNIADLLRSQEKVEEALTMYEEALAINRKAYGNEHAYVSLCLSNLALLLYEKGKYAKALPLYDESLKINRKVFGDVHEKVAHSLTNYALTLQNQGQDDEALPFFIESLAIRREISDENDPDVVRSLNNIAMLLLAKERYDEALPYLQESVERSRKVYGNMHHEVATSLNNLAMLLQAQERYEEAKPLHEESLQIRRALLGNQHPDVATNLNNLALLLEAQHELVQAKRLGQEALRIASSALGRDHPTTVIYRKNWASREVGSLYMPNKSTEKKA